MKYLIIGNGIAGISAAEAIRELDDTGEIILVSDEKELPYSRPMITYVLEGSCTSAQLPIRNSDIYERLNISPILGNRVNALNVDANTVELTSGQIIDYQRLLIASGADPRPVEAEGAYLKNIFYMRTADHARRQLKALPNVKRAVVLGGGLVGFKSAYALLKQGIPVTMLITSGYPLSMQVDDIAGQMILKEMMKNGLDVKVGANVAMFEGGIGSEKVRAVQLDTRLTLPCDLVIIGKGVLPAHSFVPKDRIDVDLGICVNQRMETSIPGIYAAGDVAECIDITRKTPWVNAIWPEAAVQGRIAGQNMAGRCVRHTGSLSRNVMRVFDLDVMTIGMADARSTTKENLISIRMETESKAPPYYRNILFRDNVPVGAVLINDIEQGGVIRSLIEQQRPIDGPLDRLLSPNFNFAKLLMLLLICVASMFSTPPSSSAERYEVGPGHTHETLTTIDWPNLQAGDEVRIHWRNEPYRNKIGLRSRGTEDHPIRIVGIPGPSGQRPIISGENATTPPSLSNFFQREWTESLGVIIIHRGPDDAWGHKPGYIEIEGLRLEGGKEDNTYQGMDGNTYAYFDAAGGIWAVLVEHFTVRDCEITDNGNGLFILSKNSEEETSRDVLIESNYIHGNGVVGSDQEHNVYTQVAGITFQYNRIGAMRANSGGIALKDRSSGTVIRYNRIVSGARTLDLVEPEDSYDILVADPNFYDTWVYGNIIINEASDIYPFAVNMFHYGGDMGETDIYRKGILHFYHNTVYIKTNQPDVWYIRLFDLSTPDETVSLRNNVFYLDGTSEFYLTRESGNHIFEANNWINGNWQPHHPDDEWHHFDGSIVINTPPLTGTNPGFTDAKAHDFTLESDSPLVDNGEPLPSDISAAHDVTRQYSIHEAGTSRSVQGSAPDIGALELSQSSDPDVPVDPDTPDDPTGPTDSEPILEIFVDNETSALPSNTSTTLHLTFNPGTIADNQGDWWIIQLTPSGIFSFDLASMQFEPGLHPIFQGAFFPLEAVSLPVTLSDGGEHLFFFGVDTVPDTLLNIQNAPPQHLLKVNCTLI